MMATFVELPYFRELYILRLGWLSRMGLSNIIMKIDILFQLHFQILGEIAWE
jgi:hypothetical protein